MNLPQGGSKYRTVTVTVLGTATSGSAAHNMGTTPIVFGRPNPNQNDGLNSYASADATNVTVTCATAVTTDTIFTVTVGLPLAVPAATAAINLATAGNFTVLAGSAISNRVTVTGNVGITIGGGASIASLTCSDVDGSIYDTDAGYTGGDDIGVIGCLITDAAGLATAKSDLVAAKADASGRTPTTVATELGGTTKTAGVYNSASGTFTLNGTLTLDAQGDTNAVFIFNTTAAFNLSPAANSIISLVNGAQARNVFWNIGLAAWIGASAIFKGIVMAQTAIIIGNNTSIEGRLLANTASISFGATNCVITPPA